MTKRKNSPVTPGEQIAQQILANYDLKDAQDVQDVLKQIFGPIFESMLKGEMKNHLGYEKHERKEDTADNFRNGYSNNASFFFVSPFSSASATIRFASSSADPSWASAVFLRAV